MEQINLKSVIDKFPECLSDDQKLKAVLLDLYPNASKGLVHVLCTVQSAGIVSEIQSKGAVDELDLCRYRRTLQENYGLMGNVAETGLALWQSILTDPKPEPKKQAPNIPAKKKKVVGSDDPTHIHHYTEMVVSPTCAAQGYTVHSCACGYTFKDNFKPRLAHDYEVVETVAPTCDAEGAQKLRCKMCGAEKVVSLPKREHQFEIWVETMPATCEAEGQEKRACKLCGFTECRQIPAKGHDFGKWNEKTHADCTHSGTETRFCRKCNFTETRKIKALGHAWNRWHPSAEKEKTAERYCSRCGQTEEEPFDYETAEKQYGTKIKDAPPIWADHLRDQEDAKEALRRQEAQRMREVQAKEETLARQQAIVEQRRQEKFAAQEKRDEVAGGVFGTTLWIATIISSVFPIFFGEKSWLGGLLMVTWGGAGVISLICALVSKKGKGTMIGLAIIWLLMFFAFVIAGALS